MVSEQLLKEILVELKTMKNGIQEVKTGQQKLETRMGSLEDGQKELQSDVSDLKKGQQKLETRMGSLEDGQKELQSDVSDLKKGQQKLETRMDSLENGQHRLETRLENEAFNKIAALFDGYSLRGDQIANLQKHLDQRLDSIETDIRYLVSRVGKLEKMAK